MRERRATRKGQLRLQLEWLEIGSPLAQTLGQQIAQRPQQQQSPSDLTDDVVAQDAFIAGMIYALSLLMLPGAPYALGQSGATEGQRSEDGQWKLNECLRCMLVVDGIG